METPRRAGLMAKAMPYRRRCCPRRSSSTMSFSNWLRRKLALPMQSRRRARRSIFHLLVTTASMCSRHRPMVIRRRDFEIGGKRTELNIQNWGGFIGQWDNRQWSSADTAHGNYGEMTGLTPGFIKRADLAWYSSHHHDAAGKNVDYSVFVSIWVCRSIFPRREEASNCRTTKTSASWRFPWRTRTRKLTLCDHFTTFFLVLCERARCTDSPSNLGIGLNTDGSKHAPPACPNQTLPTSTGWVTRVRCSPRSGPARTLCLVYRPYQNISLTSEMYAAYTFLRSS